MRVTVSTSFTSYNGDVLIQPKSHLWFIKNTGKYNARINQAVVLYTLYGQFGIDNTDLAFGAIENILRNKKVTPIENQTVFNIFFDLSNRNTLNIPDKQILLVETHFKIDAKHGVYII